MGPVSERHFRRRDFGKLAAATGAALAAPALLAGRAHAVGEPVVPNGDAHPAVVGFDTAMRNHMSARGIPNGALAVVSNRRLVLAKGYTLDDGTGPEVIGPEKLFRVGSLSKAITATALLCAAEDAKLGYLEPVANHVDLTPLPGHQADPGLADITLWDLIHHEGGWDHRGTPEDPPTYPPPLLHDRTIRTAYSPWLPLPISQQHVIEYVSGMHTLTFQPGTTYDYNNYGYLLLEKALDAVTPEGYARYVEDRIFARLGLTHTHPGRTLASQRLPDEVEYHPTRWSTTRTGPCARSCPPPPPRCPRRTASSTGRTGWARAAGSPPSSTTRASCPSTRTARA